MHKNSHYARISIEILEFMNEIPALATNSSDKFQGTVLVAT